MRINKFVAQATGVSRRQADTLISNGQIMINEKPATAGAQVTNADQVTLEGKILKPSRILTIMLNKPVGYVCSREGQGSPTIYDLLPSNYRDLKPVGRLDKDSSGLLLLTNDGDLALKLTHPRYSKEKIYLVELNKPLNKADQVQIAEGIILSDGVSQMQIDMMPKNTVKVTIREGRNRQIRRTFEALNYQVIKLHRQQIGGYRLGSLPAGQFSEV